VRGGSARVVRRAVRRCDARAQCGSEKGEEAQRSAVSAYCVLNIHAMQREARLQRRRVAAASRTTPDRPDATPTTIPIRPSKRRGGAQQRKTRVSAAARARCAGSKDEKRVRGAVQNSAKTQRAKEQIRRLLTRPANAQRCASAINLIFYAERCPRAPRTQRGVRRCRCKTLHARKPAYDAIARDAMSMARK